MSEIIGSATIEVGVDSTAAESGFAKIGAAGTRTGKTLDNLSGKASKGITDIGTAGDASSKKVESATRGMIGSIQRTIAMLEAGSKSSAKYYETLASQRGVNVDALRPYLAQLDAVTAKQKLAETSLRATDPAMRDFGISSAQTTAALRQMPAQLTDIFTSLAGGQNPLLVLIQQGGQIKDSFGGVSNTIKILGSEVASFFSASAGAASAAAGVADLGGALADVAREQEAASAGVEQVGGAVTDLAGGANSAAEAVANTRIAVTGLSGVALGPIIAVVAVLAAVAAGVVAFYQGSKEASAYRMALVQTGNAAGTTSGQLADMARNISKSVGTQGAAAEALAALAATGEVGAENLQRFAEVSVKAQKALGISVVDLAKDFAELGEAPQDGIESLNKKYHFLTLAVFEQINALVDQGRMEEAAKASQTSYANSLDARSKEITQSLGLIERAWNSLGSGAKTAWDFMLNIGREDTFDEKLKDAEAALKRAKMRRFTYVGAGADGKADLVAAEKKVALLREERDAEAWKAKVKAEGVKLDEAGIYWAKEGEKYLTRRQQMEKELEASRNRGLAAGVSDAEIEKRDLDIRKKYTEVFNGGIDAQIEAVKRRGAVEDIVAERSIAVLVANRDAGLASSLAAQMEFSQTVAELEIKDFNRHKRQLQEELSLTQGKAASEKEQAALRGQIALIDAQIVSRRRAASNEQFVLDVKATRAVANEYADLVEKREADVAAIRKQVLEQTNANAMIGKGKRAIADFSAAQQEEIAIRKEVDASILDTILGREAEADALRAQAAEIRKLSAAQREGAEKSVAFEENKKLFESLDRTAHDTFVSIFDSGKSAFDRLRDTLKNGLLDLLYQMTVRKWILSIGTSVSGAGFGGLAQAGESVGLGGGSVGGNSTLGMIQSAKSAYTIATQGFAGITAGIGGSIVTLGNMFGSSAVSAFGTGMGMTGAQAATASAAYGSAGMAGTGSALTAGAAAAPLVTAAAGIAAGMVAGKLISGEYAAIGKSGTTAVAIGSAVGAIWGPIGSAIGGAIGGLVNRTFGMGEKKYGETGVTGTLSGDSFTGNEYAKWTQKGGWLRSDKSDTDVSPVSSVMSNAFVETYAAIRQVSATLGEVIGADTTALASRVQALSINLTGLKTDAEIMEAVTKFFTGVGNSIALELVPNLKEFKLEGEELSTTLQRVAQDYTGIDQMLQMLGRTSVEAFGAVGLSTISARENLIKLAGSLDALTSGTSFFSENFLTEAEQMAPVLSTVADTLSKLGMASSTTVEDYKKKVLSLNLANTAEQELYIKLLALAPAFKSAADYTALLSGATDELAKVSKTASEIASERMSLQAELDKLTLNALQLRAKERQSIDASNLALFDEVGARRDIAAAYATESEALKSTIERLKTFAAGIQAFKGTLDLGSLSTLTPVQKMVEAQRQYEETLAKARAGDTAAQSALTAAASAYLTADQLVKASSDAYAADVTRVQSDLAALAALAGTQMSEAEKQLSVLDQQVGQLVTLNSTAVAMKDAIAALGMALVTSGKASVTAGMLDGSHASGLERVPFNGYRAELHEGEIVVDAQSAAVMTRYFGGAPRAGGGNADALVGEIKALREEVKGLRADQERQTGDVLGATAEAHRGTADAIVSGTKRALDRATFNQQTKQRGIPA